MSQKSIRFSEATFFPAEDELARSTPRTAAAAPPQKPPRRYVAAGVPPEDPAFKKFLARYEAAIKLLYAGRFVEAHAAFSLLLQDAPPHVEASIRNYLRVSALESARDMGGFESLEARYDHGIYLLEQGHHSGARSHFEAILQVYIEADYAYYGLALLCAKTIDVDGCIENLTKAIELNQQNRLMARNDSDFDSIAEDPRFVELLYPGG